MAGKGDKDRTTDKKGYDSCPLWANIEKKKGRITEKSKGNCYERNVKTEKGLS